MASFLPTRIDRATLRMITIKRSVSGALSLLFAVGLLAYGTTHYADLDPRSRLYWLLALAVFTFGGSWSLRDAIRGWRTLRT